MLHLGGDEQVAQGVNAIVCRIQLSDCVSQPFVWQPQQHACLQGSAHEFVSPCALHHLQQHKEMHGR